MSILKKIQTSKPEKSIFIMTLIKSSLLYLKGDLEKAKDLVKDCKNDFELIFYEYLNSTTQNINLDLKHKRILSSNNPTVIYYLAKIYFNQKDYDNYLYQMGRLLDFNFAYCDFLLFFDQNNDNIKFEDFAREALVKFPGDSRISYICAIHYFERNQFESMTKIISGMSDKDPVRFYLQGLISNDKNDFRMAIELDPTYHEAYMKLYDNYELTLKSLEIASCYEEVFESIRNLIIIENNEYLKRMRNDL
ncbi:hypothetical protein NBO_15g0020 [Nosema bombycis CQ1]|uniref:Uncharacterized protein n=1 Tax=Nosema bombycis (strain CQ1 / CVCC 102059) TaxID=578461 RepID=R0MPL8_NOSB1|nr:hypothetical protein NBO_15g0020 [Nosema bombycis CQ1]|eukprot:EOB14808.1 hypothetical protein NBO_15g0020 [Nosema bombycis CQ1]